MKIGEVLENFRRHMETAKEPNENTETKNKKKWHLKQNFIIYFVAINISLYINISQTEDRYINRIPQIERKKDLYQKKQNLCMELY